MDKFNPPDPFNFDGDIRKHRKRLKQELEFFLVATEKDKKENKVKPSTLVSCIGPQGREIYITHCSLRHGRLHTHMQANHSIFNLCFVIITYFLWAEIFHWRTFHLRIITWYWPTYWHTDVCTFTNNVSVGSQPESPG